MTSTHAGQPLGADERPKAGTAYIWLVILATFGVYLALVTPIALSLAIRVSQLAPGHEEYLGYITGAGAIAALLSASLFGTLSDRTRSRLGQRRPYLIGLTILGLAALAVMAQAPTIFVLGLGWVLAQIGWGTVLTLLMTSQADRLPESQRGKVSGLAGVVQQLAPVTGALLAGGLAASNLLMLLVPGALGALAMALFVIVVREPDSRHLPKATEPFTLASLIRPYLFSPRQVPDFAWNWLGKFLFTAGITFYATFAAFFLAQRMGVSVQEVAGTIAALSMGGIIAAMAGAFGGGFLSDKLRRRRIFVLLGGAVVAAGALVMALAPSLPLIVAGMMLGNLGIGIFSSVDQALMLDVLPERDTGAGRYVGIYNLAISLAQGLAPLVAPVILAVGATGADQNYTLLYLVAAAFTLAGGLVVRLGVKSIR